MNSWQLTTPQFDATEGNSNLGVMLFPTAQLRPINTMSRRACAAFLCRVYLVLRLMIALVPFRRAALEQLQRQTFKRASVGIDGALSSYWFVFSVNLRMLK